MSELDSQETAIARQLIRNPRITDMAISNNTGIPLRTVGRKRRRLEADGLINYAAYLKHSEGGTETLLAQHVYTIIFAVGVTLEEIMSRTHSTHEVTRNTGMVEQSSIGEIDGKLALILTIEGKTDREIVENLHNRILPLLLNNHGRASISEITSMRVLSTVRLLRNYFPGVNLDNGIIADSWPDDFIYVGENESGKKTRSKKNGLPAAIPNN
jgi:DNA-binding Lrp family transcriptional regulator